MLMLGSVSFCCWTVSTLFATDVAYHTKCFRSPLQKIESKNQSKNQEDLDEFVCVIED